MNLHGIAAPVVAAVNPFTPAAVQVSLAPGPQAADGTYPTPQFATPGAFTGAIAADVLTVSASTQGAIQIGQTVIGAGVLPQTLITGILSGLGGTGTYRVNQPQTVPSTGMAAILMLRAQVQPITWRDLQQVDGLNLQGTRRKIYLRGRLDGAVRPLAKGGDLVTIASGGVNDGTWLVAQVLEQFADWVAVAVTLQNVVPTVGGSQVDFSNPNNLIFLPGLTAGI